MKAPTDVARRCVCYELLLQRLGLEDDEDPIEEREKVRQLWLARLPALGLEVLPGERVLLERPVGTLAEDDLDDLHGRASGALVLLWALGRLQTRPTFASVEEMSSLVAEHGVLGDGSIAGANTTIASATLRPSDEVSEALSAYARTRGKARDPSEPDKIVAGMAAALLEWILDESAELGDDATGGE